MLSFKKKIYEIEANHIINSPAALDLAKKNGMSLDLLEELKNGGIDINFNKDIIHNTTLNGQVEIVKQVINNIGEYCKGLRITFIYNKAGVFIINDNGFGIYNQDFYLPLTPKVLIYTTPTKDLDTVKIFKKLIHAVEPVELINNIIKVSATKFIFSHNLDLLKIFCDNKNLTCSKSR